MAMVQRTGAFAAQKGTSWVVNLQQEGKAYLQTGVANPFTGGLWAVAFNIALYGIINRVHYVKRRKTAKEAVADTLKSSGKTGICTVIGLAAGNAVVRTGLVLIAPSVLPIVVGLTATFLLERLWTNATTAAPKTVSVRKRVHRKRVVVPQ
ncbi:MAG: hypothetical protein HQL21_08615 [Candidatus Omnitrophica bacterium]|nr:hypothetical protein [Candidatus Omnitrophota bacterium]